MLRSRIEGGIIVAALTIAALLGAAVGFGHRHGAVLRPFRVSGAMLLGATRGDAEFAGNGAVIVGLASLVVASLLWGIVFAIVAERFKGAKLFAVAALFTVGVFAVSTAFFPHLLHFDSGRTLAPSEDILAYALMAVALAVGMRVAFTEE